MTTDVGRIRRTIPDEAKRILYGASIDELLPQLPTYLAVDRAHIVMLVEAGILERHVAAALLAAIDELERSNFSGLRGRPAPRGLYLAYEQHLIEQTGPDVGGMLQFGRSRNDLQATVALLRHREPVTQLLEEHLRLIGSVLDRARTYARVLMPAYTHGQPAVPITLGHYLVGIAEALVRDADGLFAAATGMERCPLGAGAVGGTTLPIQPERTAALLGFALPLSSSVDGVASRDTPLRLLAACAVAGVTLSRFAQDLLAWLGEAAFLELPDELVGSSSMMPQKRNPYLLEHVQGRAARPLGAFVSACTAMHAKPFTNSIAVGTEGTAELENTLEVQRTALVLLRLVVEGARPCPERMARRAEEGFVQATEIATRLARHLGFRRAHALVGEAISESLESGVPLASILGDRLAALGLPTSLAAVSPLDVVERAEHLGAPGPGAVESALSRLAALLQERRSRLAEMRCAWEDARASLAESVARILTGSTMPSASAAKEA